MHPDKLFTFIHLYGVMIALVLATLIIFWIAFAQHDEGSVARRVYKDFVLLVAAPLAALIGWALAGLAYVTNLPIALWQALIAGLVIASGWLTSAIFSELSRARGKSERLRDYHKAIYAEIGTALNTLFDEGQSETYVAANIARMGADPNFVPFIPRERHDFVYSAISENIDVLPRQTIDAIVAYYALTHAISALADDMRSQKFETLQQDRRIAIYTDYTQMRIQAFHFGNHALRLIKAYSEKGPQGAIALINTLGAGQSAPLQESE
jgi:hypothetical protein